MAANRDIEIAGHDLDAAEAHLVLVRDWRQDTRRRVDPDDEDRQRQLDTLLRGIDEVMKPVRVRIGQLVWWGQLRQRFERRLRAVSRALQYERKQLKKMRR